MITTKRQYLEAVEAANLYTKCGTFDHTIVSYFVKKVDWCSVLEDTSYINHLSNSNTTQYFEEQLNFVCKNVKNVAPEYMRGPGIESLRGNPSAPPIGYLCETECANKANAIKELHAKLDAERNRKTIFLDLYYTAEYCFARLSTNHQMPIKLVSDTLTQEEMQDKTKHIFRMWLFHNNALFYAMNRESCCQVTVRFNGDTCVFDVRRFGRLLFTLTYHLGIQMFIEIIEENHHAQD